MNTKKITSIILIVLGLFLIAFSVYAKMRIEEAKKIVHETSSPFSSNMIGKMLGETVENKIEQYNTMIMVSLVGGIALAAFGTGMFLFFRKK